MEHEIEATIQGCRNAFSTFCEPFTCIESCCEYINNPFPAEPSQAMVEGTLKLGNLLYHQNYSSNDRISIHS